MLGTIAFLLIILWLLGLVSSYTLGGFIHILLVVAIIMFLVRYGGDAADPQGTHWPVRDRADERGGGQCRLRCQCGAQDTRYMPTSDPLEGRFLRATRPG